MGKRATSWHRQKETRRKKAKQGRSSRRKPKRNYILKGIVECANGQKMFRYNYRNGSNRSDLDCHQTSEKPEHYCLNKCCKIGPVTRYDVRIKVKVPTASKRSATPSRDETEYERRERKRNWRKYGNIKLHRIGSRCQFSLVPLEFVINQA